MEVEVTTFTPELLDQLATEVDAPVDEIVAAHAAAKAGAEPRALVSDIAANLVLPPERQSPAIAAYLADQPALPDWVQPRLLARSADFFAGAGLEIGTALFCASLPQAYAGHRGARVLSLTGRLVTSPVRRVNETAQMVFNVMAPNGLLPGARGYSDARRVRLMHAAVRYLILNDPSVERTDDPHAGLRSWFTPGGLPINQEDMLGTLLTFTTIPLETLDRQGVGYERDDAEAYLHAWSVVGHLLGVRPDLLPLTLDEAGALQVMLSPRVQGPSPDARILGMALTSALGDSLRWGVLKGLPGSLITYYVGPEIAAINGVRSDWTSIAFGPLRRLFAALGHEERHDRVVKELADHVTAAVLRGFLRSNRPGRPGFEMPRELHGRLRAVESRWHF
ncbi:MAG: oxygenase MpaB family protein [Acidimicrobiales bacterium]